MGQGSQSPSQVAWLAATAAGLSLLPWYATEGARWGAPALLLGFQGKPWLLALFLPLLAALRRTSGALILAGAAGMVLLLAQGFLFRHPKVQSVQVFGVPDSKYGEEICAWIVPKPGEQLSEEDIRAFCKDQIAHYKVPRYIRFVEALPKTPTERVQKVKLREEGVTQDTFDREAAGITVKR